MQTLTLTQLLPVPTEEMPMWAQVEAVETLDQQRSLEGCFSLPDGSVLQLQLTLIRQLLAA